MAGCGYKRISEGKRAVTAHGYLAMTAAATERLIIKIRHEHRADIHLALLQLGCALIALRSPG
jgi:hypothetical protein